MSTTARSSCEERCTGPRGTAQEQPWWADGGLRFECLGCGRCCRGESGGVFLSPEEEQRLAGHLQIDIAGLRARFETTRWRFPSLRERAGGECVMHGPDGRCRVYPCRPLMCRTWPFWPELLESQESWTAAARHCPGMNDGRLWTAEEIAVVLQKHLDYARSLGGAWGKEGESWNRASGSC